MHVVDPAMDAELLGLDGVGDDGMSEQVVELGEDVLVDEGVEVVLWRCAGVGFGDDVAGSVGVVKPSGDGGKFFERG